MQTNKNLLPQQFVKNIVENFFVCNIIVGSRFSNRAHYNEVLENGSRSWALIRRRLVLKGGKGKTYRIGRPKGSMEKGPSRPRTRIPNSSRVPRASPPFLSLPLPPSRPFLPFLGDLSCYILLSSVHPPLTLVNHPCLSSSARPIGHSL